MGRLTMNLNKINNKRKGEKMTGGDVAAFEAFQLCNIQETAESIC